MWSLQASAAHGSRSTCGVQSASGGARAIGWLRGARFDLGWMLGGAGLALASGALVAGFPALFAPVLLADTWLLGAHHVTATYTRLCCDRASLRRHRFLVFGLPLLALAGVLALLAGPGMAWVVTLYFHWQWLHYARQSWGVSQAYLGKAEHEVAADPRLEQAAFYGVPLAGLLHRSAQAPAEFLGMPLHFAPVPEWLAAAGGGAALAGVAWLAATRLRAWRQGRLPLAHTLYLATHCAVFAVAYAGIQDLSRGWLVANVWHNAQYIGFVWLYNSGRFARGVDPAARLLSTLSQPRHAVWYLAACLGVSTALYLAIGAFAALIVPPIAVYHAINFHHYVVDGVIWKLREPALRSDLGLTASSGTR
jgi:hypothetical protein